MNPVKISISEILDAPGLSIQAEGVFDLPELVVGDETFVRRADVTFDATITNGGSGIVAYGTVHAPMATTCARCLCSFDLDIDASIDAFFTERGSDKPAEEESYEYEGETLDLTSVLMEALVLEAPFAPVHDEECAGLCAECGADLNEGPCGCDDKVDETHPFAKLRDLLSDSDED